MVNQADGMESVSKHSNLTALIDGLNGGHGSTVYYRCSMSGGKTGCLAITSAMNGHNQSPDNNKGVPTYTAELVSGNNSLLKVHFFRNPNGEFEAVGRLDQNLLDDLDLVCANSSKLGKFSDPEVFRQVSEIADMTSGVSTAIHQAMHSYVDSSLRGLFPGNEELKVSENLKAFLENKSSRCVFDGEEWNVSSEQEGIMISVTATSSETGRVISFTALDENDDMFDPDDDKFLVTRCPDGMDKKTVAETFLSQASGIEKDR